MIPKYGDIGYVRITDDELEALPPRLSELIRDLFIPTDGILHIPNHDMNKGMPRNTAPGIVAILQSSNKKFGKAGPRTVDMIISSVSACHIFSAERFRCGHASLNFQW